MMNNSSSGHQQYTFLSAPPAAAAYRYNQPPEDHVQPSESFGVDTAALLSSLIEEGGHGDPSTPGTGMVYQGSDDQMISFYSTNSTDDIGIGGNSKFPSPAGLYGGVPAVPGAAPSVGSPPSSWSAQGLTHSSGISSSSLGSQQTPMGQPQQESSVFLSGRVDHLTSALMYSTATPIKQPDGTWFIYLIGGLQERTAIAHPPMVQRYTLASPQGPLVGPEPVEASFPVEHLVQHTAVAYGTHIYILGNAAALEGKMFDFDTVERKVTEVEMQIHPVNNSGALATDGNGGVPELFYCHSSCLMRNPEGENVVVTFGGVSRRRTLSDIYEFNLATNVWRRIPGQRMRPHARLYHAGCASVCGRYMYILGGAPDCKTTTRNDVVFSDFWRYDLHLNEWKCLRPSGSPPKARGSCSLIASGSFLFLYAGFNGSLDLTDFYRYDTEYDCWTQPAMVDSSDIAVGRWGYACCAVEGSLFYFGGFCKRASSRIPVDQAVLAQSVQMYRPEAPSLKQFLGRFLAARLEDEDLPGAQEGEDDDAEAAPLASGTQETLVVGEEEEEVVGEFDEEDDAQWEDEPTVHSSSDLDPE